MLTERRLADAEIERVAEAVYRKLFAATGLT